MKLACKIDHAFFDMLGDQKVIDYRQIEEISFVSNLTGDIRVFNVDQINTLSADDSKDIQDFYDSVHWDPNLPIHEILLGTEIKRTSLSQVHVDHDALEAARSISDNTKYEGWGAKA